MSGARARLLRSGAGLPGFAYRCAPRARSYGAGEKIPRLPSTALREIRQCPETQCFDRIARDRHTAFAAESLRNAQSRPSIYKRGLAAGEFESNRQQRSLDAISAQFHPTAPR